MERNFEGGGRAAGIGEILRDARISGRGWRKAAEGELRFIPVETKTIVRGDGTTKTLERVRHRGAAVIVPITDDGKVVMLRQYRPAIGAWIYELPAGTIEKGERPARCAARELEEETGFAASEVKELFSSFSSPGWSTEIHHFVLARGLRKGEQNLDEDERLKVEEFTVGELRKMIADGRIADGKTIQGIYYYLQNVAEK
jgi:ADP-ribose pyrophosphatase